MCSTVGAVFVKVAYVIDGGTTPLPMIARNCAWPLSQLLPNFLRGQGCVVVDDCMLAEQ
jgi:hypothetical protein